MMFGQQNLVGWDFILYFLSIVTYTAMLDRYETSVHIKKMLWNLEFFRLLSGRHFFTLEQLYFLL